MSNMQLGGAGGGAGGDPYGEADSAQPSGTPPVIYFPVFVTVVNCVNVLGGNSAFEITLGDTPPNIVMILKDANGTVIDLSGATLIEFHMGSIYGGAYKVKAAAAVVNSGTDGMVAYAWSEGDVDTAGDFIAEVYVEWDSVQHVHFPTNPKIPVRIINSIA